MNATNIEKALAFLEGANTGNATLMKGVLAENCRLTMPHTIERGVPNPRVGRDFIADDLARGFQTLERHHYSVLHTISEGELALVHLHMSTVIKATPATHAGPYENTYFFMFRFEDGAIAEIWEWMDTAHALAQWARLRRTGSASA